MVTMARIMLTLMMIAFFLYLNLVLLEEKFRNVW